MLSNFSFLFSFLTSAWLKVAQEQERDRVKEFSYDNVSDEEDSTDGKWVVRKSAWRCQEADRLMKALQDRLEHTVEEDIQPCIPRMEGPPCLRSIPRGQVSWAVQEGHAKQAQ